MYTVIPRGSMETLYVEKPQMFYLQNIVIIIIIISIILLSDILDFIQNIRKLHFRQNFVDM